ncbi:trypco2 family protein [Amycolatopsis sp. YIM 10]|uniref:trypco2 family protein n=1 Tax=Amycolatopsis sp. YIM 10 TaxID=2653857 RepID=UPI001290103C|nr:trypco2 family protein [Amycolatopsis sp. YIM 10]QFU89681.1 hypothetical protein YIM_22515 [Amycolatopsis sp. YIM 10]
MDDGAVVGGLAETIEALRVELTEAMAKGADQALAFELGPVNVELTLAVTREGSGTGGLKLGVVSFGAAAKLAQQETHKLTLTLNPVGKDGATPVRVSDSADGEPG